MKTNLSRLKAAHFPGQWVFWALLGIGLLQLSNFALGEAVYSSPYTFTTIAARDHAAWSFVPADVAVDSAGRIYFADPHHQVVCCIAQSGTITILAGQAGSKGSADGTSSRARFCYPRGVALDAAGNLYVADCGNNTIRRITPAGVVTTVAGLAGQAGSADGKGSTARFNYPDSLALDKAGNLYVADLYNYAIRKMTPEGAVTTIAGLPGVSGCRNGPGDAARFNAPASIAVDGSGNVYVADMLNNAIRKISPAGMVTTLAGNMSYAIGNADGAGNAARFYHPCGLAVDGGNNVYVADAGNQTIRRINPHGVVTTVAGLAGQSGSADGTGSGARFWHPAGLALDRLDNLYVIDLNNAAIRKGFAAASTNTALSLNAK